MMIEHVDAIIDLRRFQTLELGATPGKAPDALMELQATDNPGGRALGQPPRLGGRSDSAADIREGRGRCADVARRRRLRAAQPTHAASAGQAAAPRRESISRCSVPTSWTRGDIARRLGDEATFQALARRNVATLAKYRFNRIVTADPHVLHSLRNEYPALRRPLHGRPPHGPAAELLADGRIRVSGADGGRVTYHDPCYLGRYNGEIEAPRAPARRLGVERVEMERSGMRSSCCGGGGGAPLTDIPGKRRIPDIRMDHARETGASDDVAVACPNCALMLEGVVQPRPVVADVSELLLHGCGGVRMTGDDDATSGPGPAQSARRAPSATLAHVPRLPKRSPAGRSRLRCRASQHHRRSGLPRAGGARPGGRRRRRPRPGCAGSGADARRCVGRRGPGARLPRPRCAGRGLRCGGRDRVIRAMYPSLRRLRARGEAAAVATAIAQHRPRHVLLPERAVGGGDVGRRLATRLGERPPSRSSASPHRRWPVAAMAAPATGSSRRRSSC